MEFIGRKGELSKLYAEYSRDSSFVVIYGRRRVGKTTLIKEFLKEKTAFYFKVTGMLKHCISWHEQLSESGGDHVCSDRYEQFYDLLWGKNDIRK